MKTRILAFFLTLCMILSMVPAVAFAEDDTAADQQKEVVVNSQQQLIAQLALGEKNIALSADIAMSKTIYAMSDVTINLNGYKLTGGSLSVEEGVTVTIVDNNLTANKGVDAGITNFTVATDSKGEVVIKSARVSATGNTDPMYNYWATDSAVEVVTLVEDDEKTEANEKKVAYYLQPTKEVHWQVGDNKYCRLADVMRDLTETNNTIVCLDSWTVEGTLEFTKAFDIVIDLNGGSAKFGTIKASKAVTVKNGTVEIGTVECGLTVEDVKMDQESIAITSGSLTVGYGQYKTDPKSWATAGIAYVDGAQYINGFVVIPPVGGKLVAVIGDKGYSNLVEAINVADGKTIKLATDLDAYIFVEKNAVIDLNNHNLNSEVEVAAGVELTLIGEGTIASLINKGTTVAKEDVIITALKNVGSAPAFTLDGATLNAIDASSIATITLVSGKITAAINGMLTATAPIVKLQAGSIVESDTYTVRSANIVLYDGEEAQVGYDVFADAYNAAVKNGWIMSVQNNVTVPADFAFVKSVVITGGNKLTAANNAFTIGTGAVLTIDGNKYLEGNYSSFATPVAYTSVTVTTGEGEEAVTTTTNTYYSSLQAAVNAVDATADKKDTIYLYDANNTDGKNIITLNGGAVVNAGTEITFDFNGNVVDVHPDFVGSSGTKNMCFQLLLGSTVTFKNGTLVSSGYAANATASNGYNWAKELIRSYGELTIDGMTIDAGVNLSEYGITTSRLPGMGSGAAVAIPNGKVTITNSVITECEVDNPNGTAVDLDGDGKLDAATSATNKLIPAGAVKVELYNKSASYNTAELTIGDNVTINGDIYVGADYAPASDENVDLTISGKDIKVIGDIVLEETVTTGDVTVKGGTFTGISSYENFYKFCANGGVVPTGTNGNYSTTDEPADYLVSIGDVKYYDLETAFKSALETGSSVMLLKDIDTLVTIPSIGDGKDKAFFFYLNGNKLTGGLTSNSTSGVTLRGHGGKDGSLLSGTITANKSVINIGIESSSNLVVDKVTLVGGVVVRCSVWTSNPTYANVQDGYKIVKTDAVEDDPKTEDTDESSPAFWTVEKATISIHVVDKDGATLERFNSIEEAIAYWINNDGCAKLVFVANYDYNAGAKDYVDEAINLSIPVEVKDGVTVTLPNYLGSAWFTVYADDILTIYKTMAYTTENGAADGTVNGAWASIQDALNDEEDTLFINTDAEEFTVEADAGAELTFGSETKLFATGYVGTFTSAVAVAGNVYYDNIVNAIAGAADGATVTLLVDLKDGFAVDATDKTITIDLNGKTVGNITVDADVVTIKNGVTGDITINAGTVNLGIKESTCTLTVGKIVVADEAKLAVRIFRTNAMDVEDCKVEWLATASYVYSVNGEYVQVVHVNNIDAMIGYTAYADLQDAVDAAKAEDVIVIYGATAAALANNQSVVVKFADDKASVDFDTETNNKYWRVVSVENEKDGTTTYTSSPVIANNSTNYYYGLEGLATAISKHNYFGVYNLNGLTELTIEANGKKLLLGSAMDPLSTDKFDITVTGSSIIMGLPTAENVRVIVDSADVTFTFDPTADLASGKVVFSEESNIEGKNVCYVKDTESELWCLVDECEVSVSSNGVDFVGYPTFDGAVAAKYAYIKLLDDVTTTVAFELTDKMVLDLGGFVLTLNTAGDAENLATPAITVTGTVIIKNGKIELLDDKKNDNYVLIAVNGDLTVDGLTIPRAFGYNMEEGYTASVNVIGKLTAINSSEIKGDIYANGAGVTTLSKDEKSSWSRVVGKGFQCGDHQDPDKETGKCPVCDEQAAKITFNAKEFKVVIDTEKYHATAGEGYVWVYVDTEVSFEFIGTLAYNQVLNSITLNGDEKDLSATFTAKAPIEYALEANITEKPTVNVKIDANHFTLTAVEDEKLTADFYNPTTIPLMVGVEYKITCNDYETIYWVNSDNAIVGIGLEFTFTPTEDTEIHAITYTAGKYVIVLNGPAVAGTTVSYNNPVNAFISMPKLPDTIGSKTVKGWLVNGKAVDDVAEYINGAEEPALYVLTPVFSYDETAEVVINGEDVTATIGKVWKVTADATIVVDEVTMYFTGWKVWASAEAKENGDDPVYVTTALQLVYNFTKSGMVAEAQYDDDESKAAANKPVVTVGANGNGAFAHYYLPDGTIASLGIIYSTSNVVEDGVLQGATKGKENVDGNEKTAQWNFKATEDKIVYVQAYMTYVDAATGQLVTVYSEVEAVEITVEVTQ